MMIQTRMSNWVWMLMRKLLLLLDVHERSFVGLSQRVKHLILVKVLLILKEIKEFL